MAARKKPVASKKAKPAKKPAGRKGARKKTAAGKAGRRKPAAKKTGSTGKQAKRGGSAAKKSPPARAKSRKPALLSGDNPQIAKGTGDAPVQAYIAAIPGWKQQLARRLDALIGRAVPGVHKAVKWNSPFYGVQDGLWFLSFHCYTRFVKVMFMRGAAFEPQPPGPSKHADVRYYDIPEGGLDEQQFTSWVKQAAKLPGMKM